MESLFGKTFNMLKTMMDYRSERNKVIASNIANLDTKNYRPSDYVFKDDLKNAMDMRIELKKTNEKHFPGARDEITKSNFHKVTTGDKVDLDQEMAKLAQNHLMYNLSSEFLARKFRAIRNVLTEGK